VVEARFYTGLWNWGERVSSGELSLGLQTAPIDPCGGKSTQLLVIERNP